MLRHAGRGRPAGEALEAYGATHPDRVGAGDGARRSTCRDTSVIVDRIEQYRAAGIETLMLHFHPMLTGLRIFIDKVMRKLSRRPTPNRIAS